MKTYKVLERVWLYNNSNWDRYVGTFNTLEEAEKFVEDNESEWESDLKEEAETGIDVFVEVWEDDDFLEDETFVAWCRSR